MALRLAAAAALEGREWHCLPGLDPLARSWCTGKTRRPMRPLVLMLGCDWWPRK